MQNYLSGRGSSLDEGNLKENSPSFGSYLSDPSKQQVVPTQDISSEEAVDSKSEVLHQDESGIKVEVLSVDGTPTNILIHIPDGRIIDLGCEY